MSVKTDTSQTVDNSQVEQGGADGFLNHEYFLVYFYHFCLWTDSSVSVI